MCVGCICLLGGNTAYAFKLLSHGGKLLFHGVRYVDLVNLGSKVDLLSGKSHDLGGNTDCGAVGRNFAQYNGVCCNTAVITDGERTQYLGTGSNKNVVADGGVTLAAVFTSAAQSYAVVKQAVITYFGSLADDDAHAVVNDKALAYLGAGVYLNAGAEMARAIRGILWV